MGLMDAYYNFQRQRAAAQTRGRLEGQASMAAENAGEVAQLMGTPGMAPQMGGDGLISGGVSATGLMAGDMADPRTFMQMGTGLMAIPGYQQAGQQILGQAVANQLGRPMEAARLAQQRYYNDAQLQMQRQAAERARMQMVGPYKDMSQYTSAAGGLRDDARAELEPFRQQMSLYNTVQDTVANKKGFNGMSLADDELFIKSYAKMLLPGEAVMTDDIARIATSDKIDSVVRGLASKVGYGVELTAAEREQLWQSMYQIASSAAPRYEQLRSDYTDRAIRMYINPADILNTAITMDSRRFTAPSAPGGGGLIEPTDSVKRDLEKLEQETEAW